MPVGTLQRHLAVIPALPPGPVDRSIRASLGRIIETAARETTTPTMDSKR